MGRSSTGSSQNAWDTPGAVPNHLRACFHVSKIGTVTFVPSWGGCENLVTFFFKAFNGIYSCKRFWKSMWSGACTEHGDTVVNKYFSSEGELDNK